MAGRRQRDDWLGRIKAVEREFLVARKAVDDFMAALAGGTTTLPPDTKVRDANTMSENLEGTYLLRLFAAFESGLRNYWARDTTPGARDLINSITATRRIPDNLRDEVHEVREYRNGLVHEGDQDTEPVSLTEARSRLCGFFAWLPDNWST